MTFPEQRLRRLVVGPLSLGAVHRVLRRRLGLVLSRPQLRRLHQLSGWSAVQKLSVWGPADLVHWWNYDPQRPRPVAHGQSGLERPRFLVEAVRQQVGDAVRSERAAQVDRLPARADQLQLEVLPHEERTYRVGGTADRRVGIIRACPIRDQ